MPKVVKKVAKKVKNAVNKLSKKVVKESKSVKKSNKISKPKKTTKALKQAEPELMPEKLQQSLENAPKELTEEEKKSALFLENLTKELVGLDDFYINKEYEKAREFLSNVIKKSFNVDILDLKSKIASYVKENANEISKNIPYIAPGGDWSKFFNENDEIINYLKNEISRVEDWNLYALEPSPMKGVWKVEFCYKDLVTEDSNLTGYVYLNEEGTLKHVFAQMS